MKKLSMVLLLVLVVYGIARADYRDLFQRQFIDKPWAGAPIVREGVCIDCHTSKLMSADYLKIPQEWKMSIHNKHKVSCHNCHGGDPSDVAMGCESPHGGFFLGKPKPKDVPKMCGKCHIGIMKKFVDSGHGKALMQKGIGPNCVTCHGSHRIQKASIDIINSVRCSQCHTYERAKEMKQALFTVENRIKKIEDTIKLIKSSGAITDDIEKALFRTKAEFRTLFHTVDVKLVRDRTDEFTAKLDNIQNDINRITSELRFRKSFAGYILILFAVILVVYHYSTKSRTDKGEEAKE